MLMDENDDNWSFSEWLQEVSYGEALIAFCIAIIPHLNEYVMAGSIVCWPIIGLYKLVKLLLKIPMFPKKNINLAKK